VVCLGPAGSWQWTGLAPLAVGALAAWFLPTVGQVAALGLGVVFALLALYAVRMRVVLDGDRLRVRNSVRWRRLQLDQLVIVRAVPVSRSGPMLRLQDVAGDRCWIRLHGLQPHDRQQLLDLLRPFVFADRVQHLGPVHKMLAAET